MLRVFSLGRLTALAERRKEFPESSRLKGTLVSVVGPNLLTVAVGAEDPERGKSWQARREVSSFLRARDAFARGSTHSRECTARWQRVDLGDRYFKLDERGGGGAAQLFRYT